MDWLTTQWDRDTETETCHSKESTQGIRVSLEKILLLEKHKG